MKNTSKYTHIIWDWNGTLFDDTAWCVKTMNKMLENRGLKTLNGIADYHNAFCFPIIEYYKNVGFNFNQEPFEDLAAEFILLYHSNKSGGCGLHCGTEDVLQSVHKSGIKQVILSASGLNNLLSQINELNIKHYFDEILGLSDIYAKSKIDTGLSYMARKSAGNALLIGDTIHDYEVAKALETDCILIANGHQSKQTLQKCGVPVLDNISCIKLLVGLSQ